jgi:predicted transporter
MSYRVKLIMGLIGTALFIIFIFGLSHSISTGFAGFSGGTPFMIIAIVICAAALYDFWDECVRKK